MLRVDSPAFEHTCIIIEITISLHGGLSVIITPATSTHVHAVVNVPSIFPSLSYNFSS